MKRIKGLMIALVLAFFILQPAFATRQGNTSVKQWLADLPWASVYLSTGTRIYHDYDNDRVAIVGDLYKTGIDIANYETLTATFAATSITPAQSFVLLKGTHTAAITITTINFISTNTYTEGSMLYVLGWSTYGVILQDYDTLSNSVFDFPYTSRTIKRNAFLALQLRSDGGNLRWKEMFFRDADNDINISGDLIVAGNNITLGNANIDYDTTNYEVDIGTNINVTGNANVSEYMEVGSSLTVDGMIVATQISVSSITVSGSDIVITATAAWANGVAGVNVTGLALGTLTSTQTLTGTNTFARPIIGLSTMAVTSDVVVGGDVTISGNNLDLGSANIDYSGYAVNFDTQVVIASDEGLRFTVNVDTTTAPSAVGILAINSGPPFGIWLSTSTANAACWVEK